MEDKNKIYNDGGKQFRTFLEQLCWRKPPKDMNPDATYEYHYSSEPGIPNYHTEDGKGIND